MIRSDAIVDNRGLCALTMARKENERQISSSSTIVVSNAATGILTVDNALMVRVTLASANRKLIDSVPWFHGSVA